MKKFIIISVVLFGFSLVGCKGDKSGEGEGAITKEECEKDETKQWNAEANEGKGACEAKVVTKEECEKDETKQWNAEANEGRGACEAKAETVTKEKMYTITNKISSFQVSISLNDYVVISTKGPGQSPIRKQVVFKEGMDLQFDDCLEIKESHFAKMRVFIENQQTGNNIVLCDSLDTNQNNDCKIGNYEVVTSLSVLFSPSQPRLNPSSKNESECKGSMDLKKK